MLTLVFLAAILGSLVAIIAQAKGERPGFWMLYGTLLPPVALVHILRRDWKRPGVQRRIRSQARDVRRV